MFQLFPQLFDIIRLGGDQPAQMKNGREPLPGILILPGLAALGGGCTITHGDLA